MRDTPEGFDFTEEGTMNAYLSVDISTLPYSKGFILSQPFLIDQMIQALGFDPNTKTFATNNILAGYSFLNKDENSPDRKSS